MGGTIAGRKVIVMVLFSALLATVFPVASSEASQSTGPQNSVVELGDEPECQWLLTRLIDLDRCARAPHDLLRSTASTAAPEVESALIPQRSIPAQTALQTDDKTTQDSPAEPGAIVGEIPCPAYSVEQVLSDPHGDWDDDTFSNVREFYNSADPCTFDGPLEQPVSIVSAPTAQTSVEPAESGPENPADDASLESESEAARNTQPAAPNCPVYSVADVYANPTGDWDNDQASNIDEFDTDNNPCEFDEDAIASIASADTISATGPCPSYSQTAVLDDPTGDWDRDRATNVDEFYSNSNPCVFNASAAENAAPTSTVTGPCPSFSFEDVLDDADGDWDNDRVSNVDELYNNSDPCLSDQLDVDATLIPTATGPCPTYSLPLVLEDPTGDWDGDTASNVEEFYNSGNPCVYDADKASTETAEEEALRKLNEALNGGVNAQQGTDDPVEVTPELVVTGEDGSDVDVIVDNTGSDVDRDTTGDVDVSDGPQVTVEVSGDNADTGGTDTTGTDTQTGPVPWEISLTGGAATLAVNGDGTVTFGTETRDLADVSEIKIYGTTETAADRVDDLTIDLGDNTDLDVPVSFEADAGDDTLRVVGAIATWSNDKLSWDGGAIDHTSVENFASDGGSLNPGNSPGIMTIVGDLVIATAGTEVAEPEPVSVLAYQLGE